MQTKYIVKTIINTNDKNEEDLIKLFNKKLYKIIVSIELNQKKIKSQV